MDSVNNFQDWTQNTFLHTDQYPHLRNKVQGFSLQGETVSLKLNIDSSYHIYLKDHVFGTDCFVPATMIIELLFEAALFYCEYYRKIDVKELKAVELLDFSILRALAMTPGDSLDMEFLFKQITKRDSTIEFKIEIISNRVNKLNAIIGTRLNVTSQVILSTVSPQPPKLRIPDLAYTYYQVPKDQYYSEDFPSLGPLFQSSCARFAVSEDKTCFIGEYDCLGKEKNFILGQESTFVTSPLGNDSCLQYAVFFSRIINQIGRLPIGGKKLQFYKTHPLSGKVKVFVECVSIDDDMVSNIYSIDSTGIIFCANEFVVRKSPYHKLVEREVFDKMLNKHKTKPFNW
ncbi:polyketide synthase dehydratase domain-containing protein [Pelosinus baikalensis]|uniref:Polyketide synthase dehydratase domain-containing protein n=1 Tax=Pelosinus baikalensis TaxID=2892015 RepID=A0ABS8I198_9FIRM|nr:polyketide synthase dehydratase domain-containing protein [Pelosinus baikalensis]MCC5468458.1 polyketide synthase dehydratase domain-containing protein [Pelosinus baikalensis]